MKNLSPNALPRLLVATGRDDLGRRSHACSPTAAGLQARSRRDGFATDPNLGCGDPQPKVVAAAYGRLALYGSGIAQDGRQPLPGAAGGLRRPVLAPSVGKSAR
jgi:hypothetical protein